MKYSYSPATSKEMHDLGCKIAQQIQVLNSSVLLLLDGTLGVGKTTFSQGFFNAFGVKEVTSPSYGILHNYEGGTRLLYHMDLYRIHSEEDFEELGVEEILDSQGSFVFVVEWASKFPSLWEGLSHVHLLYLSFQMNADDSRTVTVTGL